MAKGKGYTVTINKKALIAKHQKAFAQVNERVLPANFDAEMINAKWQWSGTTVRRNGSTVTSPRNLVDTGELIDSYYRRKEGSSRYVHGWAARHALPNHEGAQLRNGGIIYPRPWTEEPVRFIPDEFAKAYRSLP